ncbi:hypothetical protein MSIBF_A1660002 [groundwater metagenome]|uniref:Uncharacterized protein n=1 Tax=groundwater metagenome TaxID=717931 RepID=A0A098E878_9ZZZZ
MIMAHIKHKNNMNEQETRINKVIEGIDEENTSVLFEVWKKYLEGVLIFPFEARVSGDLKGDEEIFDKDNRITVKKISEIDDTYGIIVEGWKLEVKKGRKKFQLPLDDLKVTDEESSNYQYINDYSVWMANR